MSDNLLEQTAAARRAFFNNHAQLLAQLVAEGQHPQALFIGCADSRVGPEGLLGLKPGDFFVVRNVANVVPPYIQADAATIAGLEFAVQALQVPHIVVCGHTDCGGIRALDQTLDMAAYAALSRWLEYIRPAQRDVDFHQGDLDGEERHVAIVERHVVRQLDNLGSYPFVREALEAGRLALHGWVYDLGQRHIRYYDADAERFEVA